MNLQSFFSKPPILFPLAALFHLVLLLMSAAILWPTPLNQPEWLSPLAHTGFTVAAFALCSMRKWAALVYVALSMLCLAMMYLSAADSTVRIFAQALFPLNLILSFFVLLFYKRFQ